MPENNAKITDARPRKFVFNGMQLADPDPKMTPQKVAEFHSLLHAELTNRGVPLAASRGTDQRHDQGPDENGGRIR